MDAFENDGKDNQRIVQEMVDAWGAFQFAYLEMSKPLRSWFEKTYRICGSRPMIAFAQTDYAVTSFGETLGIKETPVFLDGEEK